MTDEERSRRLFDWAIKHIVAVAIMVAAMWVVLAVMSFGIVTNARNGSDAAHRTSKIIKDFERNSIEARDQGTKQREQLQRAIQCVLDQFAEHRVTNQAAHERLAMALGVRVPDHRPLPGEPDEGTILKVCAEFYDK